METTPPTAGTPRRSASHPGLKLVLLMAWAAVSFGACFFARDLQFLVAGWPFHYWTAAQGALLAFVAIVAIYAAVANRGEAPPDPMADATEAAELPTAADRRG